MICFKTLLYIKVAFYQDLNHQVNKNHILSRKFPEGPILRTHIHPLERDRHGYWSNRSADSTGYRNQIFMKRSIDIETKNRHSYSMTTATPYTTLALSLDQFIRELDKSPLTIVAYRTDIQQFLAWLTEYDATITQAQQVKRSHVNEYLRYLANNGKAGTTRSRKLVSIQRFFSHLMKEGIIPLSPAATVDRPRKERKPKHYLRPDEYTKLLAAAGGHPRDFALLQLFLQTGIRVSEAAAICVHELDLEHKTLTIHGKGSKERVIPLEKKAFQALKSYLTVRPKTADQYLFLNYQGEGLSIRGMRKIVEKYVKRAGITKKISCHGLRHTCATNRAVLGMNAFCLKTLLGHERIATSLEYVHIGTEELRKPMEVTSL
jgi:site-specific recombinase XerD